MHDLFEGVYRYDMALIIQHFIRQKYFSLTTLNSRIKYFSFNNFQQNKPPLVTKEHLANGCIIFSASEMLCLLRNFNIIIGDLIPNENQVWQFYLLLKEINDIVTFTEISNNTLQYLKYLISEHHDMYLVLFNSTLKPKHHFLLHYPNIITKIGPLMPLSCMRFEAKHKELKNNATNVRSRRNLPLTLAKKSQLNFLYRCMSKVGLSDKIEIGEILNMCATCPILDLPYNLHDYYEISWLKENGIRFNKFNVIFFDVKESIPVSFKIIKIFYHSEHKFECIFLCQELITVQYSSHYKAYVVDVSNNHTFLSLFGIETCLPLNVHTLQDGKTYINLIAK